MFNTFTHLESIYTPFFSITKGGSQIRNTPSSGLRGAHVFILPSSTLQKLEAKQYTHSIFSITHTHTKKGARQYKQHLQLHEKWKPDNTHSIFSITKHVSQTIHTASSVSQ